MNIELKEITVRDLVQGYQDTEENGVVAVAKAVRLLRKIANCYAKTTIEENRTNNE